MRRYLVFAGSRRSTFGGWGDFKSDHDTEEEAQHAARMQLRRCDWAEVVDLQVGRGGAQRPSHQVGSASLARVP